MRLVVALVGLVVAVAAVAAFVPASVVAPLVAERSDGQLRITEPEGTLWRGTAAVTDVQGRARVPLAWRLEAASLLQGAPRAVLARSGAGPGIAAQVTLADDAIDVRGLAATLPAAILPWPAGVAAGGELQASAETLVVGRSRQAGSVRLDWPRARVHLPIAGTVDLGTVTATLTADGARWRGPLQARGGMVHVDGEAVVDWSGADVRLSIVPQPGAPEGIHQWLGPPDRSGTTRLHLTPRFR